MANIPIKRKGKLFPHLETAVPEKALQRISEFLANQHLIRFTDIYRTNFGLKLPQNNEKHQHTTKGYYRFSLY